RDRLQQVRTYAGPKHKVIAGELAGKVVAMILTGPGPQAARRGAPRLRDGHRPSWVLSAGFAGALDTSLDRNHALLPTEVVAEDGRRWSIDLALPPEAQARRLTTGRLLSVDRIIRTAAEKAALREQFQADAVDMETAAVAMLCAERATRFLAVRIISDEA